MLTHVDQENRPRMVDVSEKSETSREAIATGVLNVGAAIMSELCQGEIQSKKGPVFATAIIAATMAVKKTAELIPFCHPLMIDVIKINIEPLDHERLKIECLVACHGKTGVEIEALTGVHIAALTVHDMCKAMSPHIRVEEIALLKKSGGKKDFTREEVR